MGRLDLSLGASPLRAEHERLVRTALRRGDEAPEIPEGERLAWSGSEVALRIAREGWRARALHEHQSACVFSRLLPQLVEAEAPLPYKSVVLRAAMDELRHASLCFDVVRYLGGEPVLEAELATAPLPEHPGRSARERVLRNVLFASCLSETISTALLAEERELTREPRIQRVVEQLSADETLHARFGWSLLAEWAPVLTADEREGLGRYLPLAFGTIEAKMHGAMPLPPPGASLPEALVDELETLGVLQGPEGRAILDEVVLEVIVPRLASLGFDAVAAWDTRRVD